MIKTNEKISDLQSHIKGIEYFIKALLSSNSGVLDSIDLKFIIEAGNQASNLLAMKTKLNALRSQK